MTEYSVLIGGKAGDGIAQAGQVIAALFSALGYHVYQYTDYPSLIRGGHNFCIIRAADTQVLTCRDGLDLILALDQATVDIHKNRLYDSGSLLYDSDRVKADGQAVAIAEILKTCNGRSIMGNTAIIGAFCGCTGIAWDLVESVIRKRLLKDGVLNLAIAKEAYSCATKSMVIMPVRDRTAKPILSGNEWIGLGLLAGGIDAYIAYPMTPSSGVLHFLASVAQEAGIEVIHPESEIAVILMAQGFAYAGKKAAVGTSGGGFCLMTEGLSLAGMAEIPITIVLSQRGGPSTGLPTYTGQSDLLFACHAGQGEFPRFIAAPGTPAEAYQISAEAVRIAWMYQVPAFILTDKTLSEGFFSLDEIPPIPPWDQVQNSPPISPYQRYADAPDGISPVLAPPAPNEVIKVNSYAHDQNGITTEDPRMIREMVKKRLRKEEALADATDRPGSVLTGGSSTANTILLCWGSNRGVCTEVADFLNLRMVSPLVLLPFPVREFRKAMEGYERIILVEDSSAGQLSQLIAREGYVTNDLVLKCDGRPFTVEELIGRVRRCLI
ncbi:MAG TPA: 2-oxoacid:acceptor oxidoreductase subunit alpha [Methanospirillum sp.]|nr:2-oxoacid:acceptor oxidoreductase subunit alpha [Methanospirillum sp.]